MAESSRVQQTTESLSVPARGAQLSARTHQVCQSTRNHQALQKATEQESIRSPGLASSGASSGTMEPSSAAKADGILREQVRILKSDQNSFTSTGE